MYVPNPWFHPHLLPPSKQWEISPGSETGQCSTPESRPRARLPLRAGAEPCTHVHVFYVEFSLLLQLMDNLFMECFELLTKGDKKFIPDLRLQTK